MDYKCKRKQCLKMFEDLCIHCKLQNPTFILRFVTSRASQALYKQQSLMKPISFRQLHPLDVILGQTESSLQTPLVLPILECSQSPVSFAEVKDLFDIKSGKKRTPNISKHSLFVGPSIIQITNANKAHTRIYTLILHCKNHAQIAENNKSCFHACLPNDSSPFQSQMFHMFPPNVGDGGWKNLLGHST